MIRAGYSFILAAACVAANAAVGLAQSNQPPIGSLESIDAAGVARGWALDPDAAVPIDVHFYLDGPAGTGQFLRVARANAVPLFEPGPRGGQSMPGPVPGHEFAVPLPVRDGLPHTLYAYAIDTTDPAANILLPGSPASFTLPPTIRSIGNGTIQVGIDERCGGVLAEIRFNGSANVVNNADCGRQIQAAVYDGAALYDECAGCTGVFGWNPVQGGDMYNFGTPPITSPGFGASITTFARPYQWYPDDKGGSQGFPVEGDVRIEQRVSLVPGHPSAVRVQYKVVHDGADRHANARQELPAVYLNDEFDRVAYYGGAAPWTGGAITIAPLDVSPAPLRLYYAPESWAALVDAQNQGVAFYFPNQYPYFSALSFQGVTSGVYGQSTNYLVPFAPLTLAPYATYEIEFFVVSGDVGSARNVIYALQSSGVDAAAPAGAMDLPVAGAVVSGSTRVEGWSFDNRGIDRIEVWIDGQVAGTATRGISRPDVQAVFQGAPAKTGFRFTFDTRMYPDGTHTLSVRSFDINGIVAILPDRVVTFSNGLANPSPRPFRKTLPITSTGSGIAHVEKD